MNTIQITRKTTAAEVYAARQGELQSLLGQISTAHADHNLDPNAVHWGHCGDLSRAIELARELRDLLNGH